jgi:hypothetical protein
MAWRLCNAVVRGEIDNTVRGRVEGRLWLVGVEAPIVLRLAGNAWRDLAGTRLTFENPRPRPDGEPTDLQPEQVGVVGDLTASRKVRVYDVPLEEAIAMSRMGVKPPEHRANCLYLEWYSERNGRVVIESADYRLSITPHAWTLTKTEERAQHEANARAIRDWMKRLGRALDEASEGDGA